MPDNDSSASSSIEERPRRPTARQSSRRTANASVRTKEDETESTLRPESLIRVKNELQKVLDHMGPNSPHSTHANESSDADNEASTISSSLQAQNLRRTISPIQESDSESPESNVRIRNQSILVDIGTSTTVLSNLNDSDVTDHCCYNSHDNSHCCSILPPSVYPGRDCINCNNCMMGYLNQPVPIPLATASPTLVPSRSCLGERSLRPVQSSTINSQGRGILKWLKNRSYQVFLGKPQFKCPTELYKLNVSGPEDEGLPPRRVIFDLVNEMPRPSSTSVATNTKSMAVSGIEKRRIDTHHNSNLTNVHSYNSKMPNKELKNADNEKITRGSDEKFVNSPTFQKNVYFNSEGDTRVDFYYFDHGNAEYFRTTDTPLVMRSEILAERTERYTTRFWAEFFAGIHIFVSFVVSFILQFFKFVLYSILRPLSVGLMQLGSDYFFKPVLTTFFNGIIQPILIFLYNVAMSLRDLCDPVAEGVGFFFREVAVLFRAMRLFEVNKKCDCERKSKCGS